MTKQNRTRAHGRKTTIAVKHMRDIPDSFEPVVELTANPSDRGSIYDGVARKFIDGYRVRGRVYAHKIQSMSWVAERQAAEKEAAGRQAMYEATMVDGSEDKRADLTGLAEPLYRMIKAQHLTNYLLRKLLAKECVGIPPEPTEMEDLKQGCLEQGYLDFCSRVSNEAQA